MLVNRTKFQHLVIYLTDVKSCIFSHTVSGENGEKKWATCCFSIGVVIGGTSIGPAFSPLWLALLMGWWNLINIHETGLLG